MSMSLLGKKEFHVAPMIDVSTVEFRYFIRLLTKRAVIWNQMVVAETLVHRSGHRATKKACHDTAPAAPSASASDELELTEDLLKYCGWWDGHGDVSPHPTVCQIGSNDPREARFATRVVQKCGYDGIDLNCECPSDRVAGRAFGAALMKDGAAAAEIVAAMVQEATQPQPAGVGNDNSNNTPLPVSVKTRIGVDEKDDFAFIAEFVQGLVNAGCRQFVIHARKVYTQGLSPAQNRDIPPIDYPRVYRLMDTFPQCSFVINGGIRSLAHAREVAFGSAIRFDGRGGAEDDGCASKDDGEDHVVPCHKCKRPQGSCLHPPRVAPPNLHGVMVARLARDRPADLADVDRYFYGEASNPCRSRRDVMERYLSFLERVYPRRCCDDDETHTLGMLRERKILHTKPCCGICQEFRGQTDENIGHEDTRTAQEKQSEGSGLPKVTATKHQSGKRSRRHAKYGGAKIVTRIVDRALQPTYRILAGETGQKAFSRASHELSRDKGARNCGPGYILWKAMRAVSDDVWDKPFELSGGKTTTYYPTK
jgi:tRNA-dihydrouridine synthase A